MRPASLRKLGGLVVGLVLVVGALVAARLGMAGRSVIAEFGSGGLAQLLAESERANAAHDIREERLLLLDAEALAGSSDDVFEVKRRLAVLDWKYEQRFDEARKRLLRATEPDEAFDAWLAIDSITYTVSMRVCRSKICALVLVLAMVPGAAEIIESAVHLVTEGHLAHAAPDGDHHEPTGPEHGCTPVFHFCGCHASMSFLSPQITPAVTLRASLAAEAPKPVAPPSGFWPSIDHPPRA